MSAYDPKRTCTAVLGAMLGRSLTCTPATLLHDDLSDANRVPGL
jgi:hypothetical protein